MQTSYTCNCWLTFKTLRLDDKLLFAIERTAHRFSQFLRKIRLLNPLPDPGCEWELLCEMNLPLPAGNFVKR